MSGRIIPENIPACVDALRTLLVNGLKSRAIARELGLTLGQVSGLYRRHVLGKWSGGHGRHKPKPPLPKAEKVARAKPLKVKPQPVVAAPAPAVARETCRWLMNDARPWLYCDAPVDGPGSSWCARHRAICYVKAPRWRPGVPS